MPSRSADPGVLYTNNGTKNPPAVLGTLTVDPKYISYADGFFVFPTQTLIRATPDTSGEGQTTAFEPGQNLDAYTSFVDTSVMTPAVTRAMTITDTIGGDKASNNDPKAVIYMFDARRVPERPADPAATQLRGGVEDHQLQQRCASDAHPRQRLSGDGDRRSEPGQDGRATVGARQRQRARTDIRRHARREHSGGVDPASGVPRVRGHLRDPLSPPQPRGQRADGDHQRHPRGVDVRGGDTGIQR